MQLSRTVAPLAPRLLQLRLSSTLAVASLQARPRRRCFSAETLPRLITVVERNNKDSFLKQNYAPELAKPDLGSMLLSQFSEIFPIFGEIIGVFLKHQCYDQFFQNLALFCVKNANFFAKFFGENI
jgi:hypothetical protein